MMNEEPKYIEGHRALFSYLDGVQHCKRHGEVSLEDDIFTYSSSNCLVQNTLEVPVVLPHPGSKLEYCFHTNEEDIEFGIVMALYPATRDLASQGIDITDTAGSMETMSSNTGVEFKVCSTFPQSFSPFESLFLDASH